MSSEQLRKVATSTHSDLDRVHILIEKQEAEDFERNQKSMVIEAKEFLSQHGIVMQGDVPDRETTLKPIDLIDITDLLVKKVHHL